MNPQIHPFPIPIPNSQIDFQIPKLIKLNSNF